MFSGHDVNYVSDLLLLCFNVIFVNHYINVYTSKLTSDIISHSAADQYNIFNRRPQYSIYVHRLFNTEKWLTSHDLWQSLLATMWH